MSQSLLLNIITTALWVKISYSSLTPNIDTN